MGQLGRRALKCLERRLAAVRINLLSAKFPFFPFEPGACSVNSCNMGDAGLPLHRDCNVRRMGGDSGGHDGGHDDGHELCLNCNCIVSS